MRVIFISLFFCLGCSDSKDLTSQVKDSVSVELSSKNLNEYGLETEILSLDLVEKEKNQFVGVLTTKEVRKRGSLYYNSKDTNDNNFQFEYDISVFSDGKKFMYELKDKRLK